MKGTMLEPREERQGREGERDGAAKWGRVERERKRVGEERRERERAKRGAERRRSEREEGGEMEERQRDSERANGGRGEREREQYHIFKTLQKVRDVHHRCLPPPLSV